MDIKVGDVFVRHSDEKFWTVKWIDGTWVIHESPGKKLAMTDVHGLRNNYDRVENKTTSL